ncbi:hypothetical protein D3C80_979430 [compost metagenome]
MRTNSAYNPFGEEPVANPNMHDCSLSCFNLISAAICLATALEAAVEFSKTTVSIFSNLFSKPVALSILLFNIICFVFLVYGRT